MRPIKLLLFLAICITGYAVFAQTSADPAGVVPASAPWWLSGTISAIEGIPIIGPVVGQIAMWFGIILTIVTAVAKCAQAIVAALAGVAGFAGLDKASAALDAFQNSSTMYWLKYGSGFTKPAPPATSAPPQFPAQPSK